MTEAKKEPKGVIGIWTDPEGRVIATAADFDRSGYGGFKTWEAQRLRARDAVHREVVRAYCSPAVTDCLSSYLLKSIAEEMLRKGHRITMRSVGYDEETQREIERG